MNRAVRTRAAIALLVLTAGCASEPTMYSWGEYEELIHDSYAAPESVSPQQQIDTMEQDYQRARAANRRMPPGWHAHLGYLYYQLGQPEVARREFLTEKARFPESAVLMDRMISNLPKL